MTRIRWYGPTLVLLGTVLIVLVCGPNLVRQIAVAQTDARITRIKDTLLKNPSLAELSDAFREVAEAVEPSVVHIQVLSRSRRASRRLGQFFGEPWEEFFRRGHQRRERKDDDLDRYRPEQAVANGSGWVYDDRGHVVTAYHVIEDVVNERAEKIRVTTSSGSEYDASVVGYDPDTDVAVLRIAADNLHPSSTAGQDVEPGDIVFAFGSPFGFKFSVSQGIVSAKGRKIGLLEERGGYENFIQTDAAINPGNSGGPLTNIYGEVVGMNSSIATRTSVYNGLGFAVPVDMVMRVVDQIIGVGSVSRGYLGISMSRQDLDTAMASSFGFEGKGVLVEDTTPGDPADEAGVHRGDIITHINGEAMKSNTQLRSFVASLAPETEVEVTLFRAGETLTVKVTLAKRPTLAAMRLFNREPLPPRLDQAEAVEVLEQFGIESVKDFTEQDAERYEVDFLPGVLITEVRPGSMAAARSYQLAAGMIITHVMGQAVPNTDELARQINDHDPAEGIRISIVEWGPRERAFFPRFVIIRLPSD